MAKGEHSVAEVGDMAPDFELMDQHEQTHRLSDYRGRWVVLYFYPKDATPGCTKQACGFRDAQEELTERGAVVLGVSRDAVQKHRKFAENQGLAFALLADTEGEVCEKYGVIRMKNTFGKTALGIVRTTYLINPQGKVAQRWDKVKVEGHVAEVVAQVGAGG